MATITYGAVIAASTPAEVIAAISTYSPSKTSRTISFAGYPIVMPATAVAPSTKYYWS